MRKEWISPRHKITQLADEDVFEISSKPKTQRDDKLSQVGNAVLQLSKLLLLRFIYFLENHLIQDSFKILYLGELYSYKLTSSSAADRLNFFKTPTRFSSVLVILGQCQKILKKIFIKLGLPPLAIS